MKRSLLNIAMALCIGLFAACSQEEIISPSNGEVETVSIDAQLPQTVGTRSLPGAAEGHQLRCILEVWDKAGSGTLITRIEKLATAATDGKLQFSFSVTKDVNYQCLLWADFIASDATGTSGEGGNTIYADKYFTTTNLKAIDFKATDASLFNNASADAFCAAVDKNGTTSQLSVTLKRPFTKVTLKDATEYINDCENFSVEYKTPSGYNIVTGIATTTKAVKAIDLTPTIESKTWFSTFIFASTDQPTLDQPITMMVKKTGVEAPEKKVIKGGQISLDANKENNAEASFSDDEDVKIEVDVDSEFPDPNALKIGQFVNKDGTVTTEYNKDNAIGIVFAAAKGKTDTSNYGEGKTIAGYAMALMGTPTRYTLQSATDTEGIAFPVKTTIPGELSWAEEDYSGYAYTQTLIKGLGEYVSPIFTAYNELVKQPIEANNLSAWYIPSARQLLQIVGMLYPGKKDLPMHGVTTNADFKESYDAVIAANPSAPYKIDFGKGVALNILSSSFKELPYAVQTTTSSNITSNMNSFPIKATQFAIRPVFTIFK